MGVTLRWRAAHCPARLPLVFLVFVKSLVSCLAASLIDAESLRGCAFEIIMVDDRPWNRVGWANMPYWVAAAILNSEYATRFGYEFRLVRPRFTRGSYPGWFKVMYMVERLEALSMAGRCAWMLYMDSDAFVRESNLPLDVYLADLADRYAIPHDVGAIFALEQNLTGAPEDPGNWPPQAEFLNTGVFLVQSSPWGRGLFDAWLAAARAVLQRRLWTTWPGEQGILSELLRPGSYAEAKSAYRPVPDLHRSFAAVNMTELNSPWGRFVQHSWGKTATATVLRERSFRDALLRIDGARPDRLAALRGKAFQGAVAWTPWAEL
mmetsp:Transcript_65648/g.182654  ORF Transcript_65648/g.182654 Transcript_65648/m.182654 type:complete len:321 (-) Transcript_65648:24-986(-)